MGANSYNAGIKEVVTLTSDLSRKNLEKDFERMDTPQGTFYRMSQSHPLCRDSLVMSMLNDPLQASTSTFSLHSTAANLMPSSSVRAKSWDDAQPGSGNRVTPIYAFK